MKSAGSNPGLIRRLHKVTRDSGLFFFFFPALLSLAHGLYPKVTLQVQDGGWNFNHHNQVPGRNLEGGGKGKKVYTQVGVAPLYEAFLGIPGTYILFVMAKFHGQT